MDTITPSPIESIPPKVPNDLIGVEKKEVETVPVYELGSEPEKKETELTPEAKATPGPSPQANDDDNHAKKIKQASLLDKIQTTLKIKKAEPIAEDEVEIEKETPDSVWVERVKKVISLFGKKPKEEQDKAQILEEGYLEEKYKVDLKDNGDE